MLQEKPKLTEIELLEKIRELEYQNNMLVTSLSEANGELTDIKSSLEVLRDTINSDNETQGEMVKYWQRRLINDRKLLKQQIHDLESHLEYIKTLLKNENVLVIHREELNKKTTHT